MRYFELYPKKPPRRPFILRVWDNAWIIAIILWLFFFWILPEIGHQVLLRDDYYGMKNYPEARPENIKCEDEVVKRVEGKFIGIYPYAATLRTGCLLNDERNNKDKSYVQIKSRKPHTFIQAAWENLMDLESGSFIIIFYQTYPLALNSEVKI